VTWATWAPGRPLKRHPRRVGGVWTGARSTGLHSTAANSCTAGHLAASSGLAEGSRVVMPTPGTETGPRGRTVRKTAGNRCLNGWCDCGGSPLTFHLLVTHARNLLACGKKPKRRGLPLPAAPRVPASWPGRRAGCCECRRAATRPATPLPAREQKEMQESDVSPDRDPPSHPYILSVRSLVHRTKCRCEGLFSHVRCLIASTHAKARESLTRRPPPPGSGPPSGARA
jgi:hypothetical protein